LNLIRVMPAKGQDNSMQKSQTIARLVGPVLSAIGIGMLANEAVYRQMAAQFLAEYPFIYFSGILALVAGLYILNVHNVWTRDWRTLITAIAFRVMAPQFAVFVAGSIVATSGFFLGAGIVLLALGGFITFKGYGP
jgi:hypothetical protein